MEKLAKIEPGNFYHIYNRGNNNESLFVEDINYLYFIKLLFHHLLSVAEVYSFALLKNHFHLLVYIKERQPDSVKKVSQPFSNFFNAYAKSINKKYKRTGSLFEDRFERRLVDNEFYLKQLVLYIHLNPVKHKLKVNFTEYPYSSYCDLISTSPTNLSRKMIFELFDGRENFIRCHADYLSKLKCLDEMYKSIKF